MGRTRKIVKYASIRINKLMVMYDKWQIEQIGKSWFIVSREERKHRLRTIMQLSVELEAIKKVSIFATAFGEMVIEAIIQGNWKEAEAIISDLSFNEDGKEIREKYVPLWESFKTIASVAIAENKQMINGKEIEAN